MTRDELSNFIENANDQYWKITLVSVFAQIALVITIVMADTDGYELLLSVSIAIAALIQVIAGDSSLLNASVASSDLQNDEVTSQIILSGVGALNESDIMLAVSSGAIVIAFNVRADAPAKRIAKQNNICLLYTSPSPRD